MHVCGVCQKKLGSGLLLQDHKARDQHYEIQDVLAPRTKKFQCSHCNFQDDLAENLHRHQARHHTLPLGKSTGHVQDYLSFYAGFKCPFRTCNFYTLSKLYMAHHFNIVHSNPETFELFKLSYRSSACPKCKIKFKNSQLKTHLKSCRAE